MQRATKRRKNNLSGEKETHFRYASALSEVGLFDLFYRNGFCKISRLVYIAASAESHVVGENL